MNIVNKFISLPVQNKVLLGGTAFLVLAMPVLILSLSQSNNKNSFAAGQTITETEKGMFTGDVSVVNDANASGGQYVLLGSAGQAPAPTAIPTPTQPASGGSTANCGTSITKSDGTQWQCTFQDEFDGTKLSSTWEEIPYGLGDSCLYNDPQHVRVANGNLELIATRNSNTDYCFTQWGLRYTGGGIQSQGQFAQKYGRFEIRAKFPKGDGFWPAFWLLPGDDSYDGEIDILESYGGRVEQGGDVGDFTLHVPAAGPGPQKTCRISPDYSSDYHTYTFEWKQGNMKAYYDGKLCADFSGLGEPNGTNPPAFPATFDKPYHILLNLAVQPWWPPTSSTQLPATMQVDYVRVWK